MRVDPPIDTAADAEVAVLRRRAAVLVDAARRLDALPWDGVRSLTNDDTWRGPLADAFAEIVRASCALGAAAASDLRATAAALEAEALAVRHGQIRAGLRS